MSADPDSRTVDVRVHLSHANVEILREARSILNELRETERRRWSSVDPAVLPQHGRGRPRSDLSQNDDLNAGLRRQVDAVCASVKAAWSEITDARTAQKKRAVLTDAIRSSSQGIVQAVCRPSRTGATKPAPDFAAIAAEAIAAGGKGKGKTPRQVAALVVARSFRLSPVSVERATARPKRTTAGTQPSELKSREP